MLTAVLVDGAFFLHRYGVVFPDGHQHSAPQVAKALHKMALRHCHGELYRLFYYDCPPYEKKGHHPLTQRPIDFSKTPEAQFRQALFEELKRLRKVALRLGHLQGDLVWNIRPQRFKEMLAGKLALADLKEADVFHDVRQKGVDIKIGVDIASLAFKKQVQQIVLIAGDADFVPAAKLARREGIDFILDPMWSHVAPALYEHIDGLMSQCPNPAHPANSATPTNS